MAKSFKGSGILLVWDSVDNYPETYERTVLWNSFNGGNDGTVISLPKLVESNSDKLRAGILKWIYRFGQSQISSTRITDLLEIEPGLSYWWFTSLGQKTNISDKSPINDAIKALAFEEYVDLEPIHEIHLTSTNKRLIQMFSQYSKERGFKFSVEQTGKEHSESPKVFERLPDLLKALLYFFWYLIAHFSLITSREPDSSKFSSGILFADVLVHLNKQSFEADKFVSNYWTSLPLLLQRLGIKSNWFHNFYRHTFIPSIPDANNLIKKFNQSALEEHTLIESFLSFGIMFNALRIYLRLFFKSFKFSKRASAFKSVNSHFNFAHLFYHELMESMKSKDAMSNCIRISLIDRVYRNIPQQKQGFYILENQPWELAMVFYWKKYNHGQLIGIPHTTVRFWDLRYFYDQKIYYSSMVNNLPMPHLIALNGKFALNSYLYGCYPAEQLRKAEALRYLQLRSEKQAKASIQRKNKEFTILVCGDFLKSTNDLMLKCLLDALNNFEKKYKIIIKPHPSNMVNEADYPGLKFNTSNEELPVLFTQCNIVFTSNITSAAVDAYYSGIPLVQFLDGTYFNVSPLREVSGIKYITDSHSLLESLVNLPQVNPNEKSYFYINENLDYWRDLLIISREVI